MLFVSDAAELSRLENSVDSEYQLTKNTRVKRNEDETVSVDIRGLDWFRSDNPNVMTALPVISQLETEGDYINAPAGQHHLQRPKRVPRPRHRDLLDRDVPGVGRPRHA